MDNLLRKVHELYDQEDGAEKGIFRALYRYAALQLPWLTKDSAYMLDNLYYNHSGLKTFTFMFARLLTEENFDAVCSMILIQFKDKWNRYYDVLSREYNPLLNMEYQEDNNERKSRNETENSNKVNSYSDNKNTSAKNENSVSNINRGENNNFSDTDYYGFNSGSPSNQNDNSNSTVSKENNLTLENDLSKSNTNTTADEKEHNLNVKDYNEDLNKSHYKQGIDNVSRSSLILEELEMRKIIFYDEIFDDLDSLITIPIYY